MAKSLKRLLNATTNLVASISFTANAFAAPTVTVSVGGQNYNVTYTTTSYNASTSLLQSQPCWGSISSATSFATAVEWRLFYPNTDPNTLAGPYFVYSYSPFVNFMFDYGGFIGGGAVNPTGDFAYATATSNISSGTTTNATALIGNPTLSGGTLVMNETNGAYSQNFTVSNATTSIIDQDGNTSTFTGIFSGGGNLVISNTGSSGKVIFTGANTYTGTTTITSYKRRRESVPLNRFNLASKGGAKVYRSC